MKKILSILLILFSLLSLISFEKTLAKSYDTYFVVTAYYSPLPNQRVYLKWNYKAEIRLNWRGIQWASGEKVFPGMIAAPKKYKFWTVIKLDWVWVWIVTDRWWAIVKAWKRWYRYDRLDIWMWHWEEGLKRALTWGKRTIKWKVLTNYKWEATIDLSMLPTSSSWIKRIAKKTEIFDKGIWKSSKKKDIVKLQNFLKNTWIYEWKIDGKYNKKLIEDIIKFQKENSIIKSKKSLWAGYWWVSTRSLVLENFLAWEYESKATWEKSAIPNIFKKNLWPESKKEDIEDLQKAFKNMWIFWAKIDWKYESIKEDIIKYQLENKLITNRSNYWAGYFGPKTRANIEKKYLSFLKDKKLEEKIEKEIEKKVESHIASIWKPKLWEIWWNVRKLQKTMKILWYFDVKDSAIYWPITMKSVLEYQIDKWIIKSKKDSWAGYFWPKTRDQVKKDLVNIIKKKRNQEKWLVSFKK